MAKTIIGFFPDKVKGDRAVDALIHYGYRNDEVSLIAKDGERFAYEHPGASTGNSPLISALAGLLIGAAIGAVVSLFISLALDFDTLRFQIPGLSAVASNIVLGAIVGGLIGGIIGLFVGRDEYKGLTYEDIDTYGQVLVAVPASNDEESEVKGIMREYGAVSFQTIDLNEYVESEESSRYNPFGLAGFKGGRRREKIRD